jgi:hypothetical protein
LSGEAEDRQLALSLEHGAAALASGTTAPAEGLVARVEALA